MNNLKTIETIVREQKQEIENFPKHNYIIRQKQSEYIKWLDSKLVKVILGPRRAGKSVFAHSLLKDKKYAYLNFDDEYFLSYDSESYTEITNALKTVYMDFDYIYFDEIQNLPRFELYINKLHRQGFNLIITGSNANLLSEEFATHLTGRYIDCEILPFSYKECVLADKNITIDSYLKKGSYPEVVTYNLDSNSYLDSMYDAIFYKDIVQRYNLRNSKELMSLSVHLIQNITSLYSNNSFKKYGFKSDVTIDKYIQYLKKTYLFFSLERFTNKGVLSHKDLKKIYCIDNGFAITKSYILSENNGKLLENLVFTELLKYGNKVNKNVFYFKTKEGYEVDFILKEKEVVHTLIQVCYDLSSQNTLEREVRSLVSGAKELKCKNLIIVSMLDKRELEVDGVIIKVIPVSEWLTNM